MKWKCEKAGHYSGEDGYEIIKRKGYWFVMHGEQMLSTSRYLGIAKADAETAKKAEVKASVKAFRRTISDAIGDISDETAKKIRRLL